MKKSITKIALVGLFTLSLFSFNYVNQFTTPQNASKLEIQNVTECGDNLVLGIKTASTIVRNVKKVLTNSQ